MKSTLHPFPIIALMNGVIMTLEEKNCLCGLARKLFFKMVQQVKDSFTQSPQFHLGLSAWPAAWALAEFSAENCGLFSNKKILELGSGLGVGGIMLR